MHQNLTTTSINVRAQHGGFAPFVRKDPTIVYALKMVAINRLGVLDLEQGESDQAHALTTAQLRDALSSAFLCGMNHATALGMIEASARASGEVAPRHALDASSRADRRVSLQGHAS